MDDYMRQLTRQLGLPEQKKDNFYVNSECPAETTDPNPFNDYWFPVPTEKDAMKLAFGFLWHITTTDTRIHSAKRALSERLTKDERGQGIEMARKHMPVIAEQAERESVRMLTRE